MKLTQTPLAGAWLVDIEPVVDARGLFARTVCRRQFMEHGLCADFIQQSVSWNKSRGIIRGLHYQEAPYQEDKLVRVTAGRIFDVIVDLRRTSTTFAQWFGVELSAENRRALYIPKGFAHGFQVLQDGTELLYEMTTEYVADASAGIRWNDHRLGIQWPEPDLALLSDKDLALPDLNDMND